jgi:alanine racemase
MLRAVPESPIATIDLNAVAANFRTIQQEVGSAEVAGVIKADAYGLGWDNVASTLYACGCRSFYTAHLSESLEARKFYPDIALTPLNGLPPGSEAEAQRHNITPVVYDLATLERVRALAHKTEKKIAVTLFFDTGINRLGFTAWEQERLINDATLLQGVEVRTIMSHLACADEPTHELNGKQLANFREIAPLFPQAKKSFANSPSVFLSKDYHFDQVRTGRALSGMNLPWLPPDRLQRALTVEAPILQVRLIDRDGTVGYGATQRVTKGMRLATLAGGYAQGFTRNLSNSDQTQAHRFTLAGFPVPVVGRISMELTVVDVSAVPEQFAHAGALVEIIGPSQDVDALGLSAGTIGYEMMTLIGPRVDRHIIALREEALPEQRRQVS